MKSIRDRRQRSNPKRCQIIEMPRKITCTLLEQTERKIFNSWKNGVGERELARQYRVGREEIEAIIREWVTGREVAA